MGKKTDHEKYFEGLDDMPFHMLIERLMAKPRESTKEKLISGCEIFFPDTVFYEKGMPKMYAMNDKDFCLARYNQDEEKKP